MIPLSIACFHFFQSRFFPRFEGKTKMPKPVSFKPPSFCSVFSTCSANHRGLGVEASLEQFFLQIFFSHIPLVLVYNAYCKFSVVICFVFVNLNYTCRWRLEQLIFPSSALLYLGNFQVYCNIGILCRGLGHQVISV